MTRPVLPNGYKNIRRLERQLASRRESKWLASGQKRAFKLFHEMAANVPAYKDFLKSQKFSPANVKSPVDIRHIPPTDKDNYLRKYPKQMLTWEGGFPNGQWVISTTSGSTGQPYYFPRQAEQDMQYAVMAELYLRSNFEIQNRKTLYIVAFPMGAWIGGLFTYEAIRRVAQGRGYDISIITPGIHKQEVISAVKQLGGYYDQILIGAYAPFLKDILDDGTREGIDWKKHRLGFIFSAEAFSEQFRDYVIRTTGLKNEFSDTLNHYGTVDLGTMAHETPEAVMIRRQLVADGRLEVIFPEANRQATFAQYNPEMFYFEAEADNLFCSAYSGLPLMRYDLKDYGGVLSRQEVHARLKTAGYDMQRLTDKAGISRKLWNLPFVYVYERNDFSVSYYSFLIYPDVVRRALQAAQFHAKLTGKFTMAADYDKAGRQRLDIHIELKHGVKSDAALAAKVKDALHQKLHDEVSEYREVYKTIGETVKPHIQLWPYESAEYFRPGTKQKWVKK